MGVPHAGRPLLSLRDISPALRGNLPPNPRHEYFLTLAGPGVGGGSGRAPKPLPALPFLVRRKGSKRLFRGCPPKDPQGERSGRPARGPSPFVATRHFPRTAGESSPPPRPDSLVVTTNILRAKRCAPFTGKFLRFIGLSQNRTTARQAVSPVSGARCLESSQCNLSLFRPNRAGMQPR